VIDMADAPVRHEATDEELRAAWNVCRASSWPATFEETMADPLRSRVVHLVAAGRARKKPLPAVGTLNAPACHVHACDCADVQPSRRCANCTLRPPPARAFRAPEPGFVDRKRLAAGDRDDD
jgi:hypothetical protein